MATLPTFENISKKILMQLTAWLMSLHFPNAKPFQSVWLPFQCKCSGYQKENLEFKFSNKQNEDRKAFAAYQLHFLACFTYIL